MLKGKIAVATILDGAKTNQEIAEKLEKRQKRMPRGSGKNTLARHKSPLFCEIRATKAFGRT